MKKNDYIFGNYDQATLDQQYDNKSKIPNASSKLAQWLQKGVRARQNLNCELDINYSTHDRQKLDIFPTKEKRAPVVAFIHGGYWYSQDRELAHFLAPFYVASGVNFVSIGYRICPDVNLKEIVDDIGKALIWLHKHGAEFGANRDKLFVAGHSAGGHLAAMACGPFGEAKGLLKGGCSVSGLHDLSPIRLSYLNKWLNLDPADAKALSPIALVQALMPGSESLPPMILAVGTREGPEYTRQRNEFLCALREASQPVSSLDLEGSDHFSACEAFCTPTHALSRAMLNLIFCKEP